MNPARFHPGVWIAAALALTASAACPAPSANDAGVTCAFPCPETQVCDGTTGQCVAALPEGSVCPDPDGGLCAPPLVCGPVTATEQRCSTDCTTRSAPFVCTGAQGCYARPEGDGGFCVTPVQAGQACDVAQLVMCAGADLICVARFPTGTAGQCFVSCNPSNALCDDGQPCVDPWAPTLPDLGICTNPLDGGACDYAAYEFCPRGETCAGNAGTYTGFCHVRCSPSTPGSCATTQSCVTPWPSTPNQGICVTPQTQGEPCNPSRDQWCANGLLCVYVQANGTVCAVDCTGNPGACSGTGKTCKPLGNGESACE